MMKTQTAWLFEAPAISIKSPHIAPFLDEEAERQWLFETPFLIEEFPLRNQPGWSNGVGVEGDFHSTRHLPRGTKLPGRSSNFPNTSNPMGTAEERKEGSVKGRGGKGSGKQKAQMSDKRIPKGREGIRDHVKAHGSDTNTKNARDYKEKALKFFQRNSTKRFYRGGSILHYNLNSLEFGVSSTDGKTIHTYHRNFKGRDALETYLANQGLPHIVLIELDGSMKEISSKKAEILVKQKKINTAQLSQARKKLI